VQHATLIATRDIQRENTIPLRMSVAGFVHVERIYLFVLELYTVERIAGRFQGSDVAAVARFAVELATFVVATTAIGMAAASCRRTVGSGIVTAIMSFVLLAFMTMLSFRVIAPQFVLMRYFSFAFGELKNPFPTYADSPFIRVHSLAEFYRVALVTALLFMLPALLYFRTRDVVD
jgi:hypothetical protein